MAVYLGNNPVSVYNGGQNSIKTEEKTVTAGTSTVELTPDSGKLLSKVTVHPTPSQSKSVTPSSVDQNIIPDNGRLLSSVAVSGDADLVAENIKSGVNIFGIDGTFEGKGQYAWERYEVIPPYLRFIGNEDFTLKTENTAVNWDGTLEYSTDTTTWNIWDGTEISSFGNNLYLRGTGNSYITGGQSGNKFVFTEDNNTLRISCEGNIENLLDYETVNAGNHPAMANYCYYYMFRNCINITIPPELPATTLASYCYDGMFYNCSNLTTAPQLPATTLANNCYANMFYGCTNLATAPELPATTLTNYCYYNMFYGCTNLTTTPDLPAITLANYCYRGMFSDCTGLTITPELPATTLANECYEGMFRGCTNLTTIPSLPATALTNYCYEYMFYNCKKIKLSSTQTENYQTAYRIPISGTGTTGTGSLSDMFGSTGGTFKGTPTINTTYYTSNTVV